MDEDILSYLLMLCLKCHIFIIFVIYVRKWYFISWVKSEFDSESHIFQNKPRYPEETILLTGFQSLEIYLYNDWHCIKSYNEKWINQFTYLNKCLSYKITNLAMLMLARPLYTLAYPDTGEWYPKLALNLFFKISCFFKISILKQINFSGWRKVSDD